jgi:hypothetical protein
MVAVGLGLEENEFLDAGKYGYVLSNLSYRRGRLYTTLACYSTDKYSSHLLAPTATNLTKYGKIDTYVPFHRSTQNHSILQSHRPAERSVAPDTISNMAAVQV